MNSDGGGKHSSRRKHETETTSCPEHVFLTDRGGKWEIWVIKADGSKPRPLFGTELAGLALEYAFAGERAIDWTE